jgi:hypothetical protein
MRLRLLLTLLALTTLALVGCNKGSKLIGKWSTTMNNLPIEAEYKPDSTFVFTAKPPMAPGMLIHISGQYTEKDDKIKAHFTDVDLENVPPEAKAQEAALKAKLLQQVKGAGEGEVTIKWEGNDSFTTTNPAGRSTTFTRIK